jgi:hypothetical protein
MRVLGCGAHPFDMLNTTGAEEKKSTKKSDLPTYLTTYLPTCLVLRFLRLTGLIFENIFMVFLSSSAMQKTHKKTP